MGATGVANWSQYVWFSQGVRRGTLATGFPVTVPVDDTSCGLLRIASTKMKPLPVRTYPATRNGSASTTPVSRLLSVPKEAFLKAEAKMKKAKARKLARKYY